MDESGGQRHFLCYRLSLPNPVLISQASRLSTVPSCQEAAEAPRPPSSLHSSTVHLHSVLFCKNVPQICVSPSLPCLYLGNPQSLSPGMSPALTGLPWGFTRNIAGRVGLSRFLPVRSLLWCHVLAEPPWGAQAPSSQSSLTFTAWDSAAPT